MAEVERIKAVKCRARVYEGEFERFSGAYCFTNTHQHASGCQAEYVRGTCMDGMPWKPGYLQHRVTLAEFESVQVGTCPVRVYRPQFHRFLSAYSVTNTYVSVVVVRQNMREVPVWTGIRDTSSIEGVWRKLRA